MKESKTKIFEEMKKLKEHQKKKTLVVVRLMGYKRFRRRRK